MRNYQIVPNTIADHIIELVDNLDSSSLNLLLAEIPDKTLSGDHAYDLLCGTSPCLIHSKDLNNAKELVNKVDLSSIPDESHYEIAWGIANGRGKDGKNDPTFLIIKHLIDSGLNVGAVINYGKEEKSDLLFQISSQFVAKEDPKHATELAIVEAIIETGLIAGFKKGSDAYNQIMQSIASDTIDRSTFLNRQEQLRNHNPSELEVEEMIRKREISTLPTSSPEYASITGDTINKTCCTIM